MAPALTAELMVARDGAGSASALPVEAELVRRTRQGESAAFEELVKMFQNRVINFVLARVRDRQKAEDITQEVLVKAYFSLHRLREPAKFRSWLFSIAHNHLRDLVRKRKLETADVEESCFEHYVDRSTPERELGRDRVKGMVHGALARLKPEQREILVLCDIEGLSYREIADIMRVPLGTVQSRIFYARKRIKEILITDYSCAGEES